jgi:hypothetical protein
MEWGRETANCFEPTERTKEGAAAKNIGLKLDFRATLAHGTACAARST